MEGIGDRTSLFLEIRDRIHGPALDEFGFGKPSDLDQYKEVDDERDADDGLFQPAWLPLFTSTEHMLTQLESLLKLLTKEYNNRKPREIGEFGVPVRIQTMRNNFEQMLTKLQKLLISQQDRVKHAAKSQPTEANVMFQSLLRRWGLVLQRLSIEYHTASDSYLEYMVSQTGGSGPGLSGPQAGTSTLTRHDDPEVRFKFSDQQLQEVRRVEHDVALRGQEIQSIVTGVQELHQLMQDIATLAEEQGTYLDQIDSTLTAVNDHTTAALANTDSARRRAGSGAIRILIIFLIIFIVAFVATIILL